MKCTVKMYVCEKQNTCYDCNDKSCIHCGDKGSDCPKYICDNPNGKQECNKCKFINKHIKEMRKIYSE